MSVNWKGVSFSGLPVKDLPTNKCLVYHDFIISCSVAGKNPPQFTEPNQECEDTKAVDELTFDEPKTFQDAICSDNNDRWKQAM